MNLRLTVLGRRITIFVFAGALIVSATTAQATPVFYLSTQSTGATPGLLNVSVAPNSTGTLHIWANSDVRLAGVSLDLIETGGFIKFQGPVNVANPVHPVSSQPRWTLLDGPQVINNSAVTNIGGAALPGLHGDGIGQGSAAGANVLVASVPYMALAGPVASQLQLRVGNNAIADWDSNFAKVRFGTDSGPLINGDSFGTGGTVGLISSGVIGERPIITPVNLGEIEQATTITANLIAANGPATWSGLIPTAGTPAIAATLTSAGVFSWNPAGSQRGPKGNGVAYSWTATAANSKGQDTNVAITLSLIPEPAASVLVGIGALGLLGIRRRAVETIGRIVT